LETRTLLSNAAAPIMGPLPAASLAPVASETTWNLQLQPGGAGALSTLSPAIAAAGARIGATPVRGLYVVHGPPAAMAALGARLTATPGVASAEPQRILSIAATPDDPNYTNGSEWQLNGTWGIKAPGAWNVTVGTDRVIVADTDTGLNYNLADMNDNVWLNQAEIPANVKPRLTDVNGDGFITFSDLNHAVNQGSGKIVDTNKDGVITGADVLAATSAGGWASGSTQDGDTANPDDLIGWNYAAAGSNGITGTNNPTDDNGHGTFTAGEIAAVGNNALGVTGVEWNAQLMPVKFLDKTGNGTDTAAASAIEYAVDHGAKVINASWGGAGTDDVIQSALKYADQHGVIVVCAAGNSGTNDDNASTFFAPASYSLQDPNVISVAASTSGGQKAGFSNYGVNSVQLAAPGVSVYSLGSGGTDGLMSGTSMAAPLVTGTIALVYSAHPTWSMSQVIDAVLDHTTPDSNLNGVVKTGGIVNATAAVANTDGPHGVASTPVGSIGSAGGFNGVQVTFNEEVNPATFTGSQVTLTGPNGAISGLTVSAVSGSNDHQFLVSFPGQTTPGTYTLRVGPAIRDWYGNAMNQNRNGVNGEASDAFTTAIQETRTTATLLKSDATTRGTWIGTYGAQGHDVIGKPAGLPGYAAVTPSGAGSFTWAASTTDVRALQVPGSTSRIAACWYSGSGFTVDVNLSDGQAHKLELYFLDWDSTVRAETVTISDAATGAVLSTRSISSFHSGLYLDYQVSGHLRIRIARTGGANAVLSGLFLG
jgi:subtilisin family serine protease